MSSPYHYTINEKVGSGSYGVVYELSDRNNKEWAVKQILRDNSGIPCLLEMIIMSSIRHPNLNHSNKIISTENHINIIQEKAISDLSVHIYNKVYELDLIRKWLHMITQSLSLLHHLNLIHADIKSGNVLYYNDDDVRLTDFTLTTKKWTKEDKFYHTVCTYNHCPPEVLKSAGWDEKIDIWSLGCLFYEVAFGNPLFPNQTKLDDKKELKRRYYNSIAKWLGYEILGSDNQKNVIIHPCYNDPKYSLFRNLIEKMVIFIPENRITVNEILEHSFFTGLSKMYAEIREPIDNNISTEIEERFKKTCKNLFKPMIKKMGDEDINYIIEISFKIFKKVSHFSSNPIMGESDITVVTCCWIAFKIFCGDFPLLSTSIEKENIIKAELEMCTYLSFCLPISL